MFFYSETDPNVALVLSVNSSSLVFQNVYINSLGSKTLSVSASAGNVTETITISDNSNLFSFSPSSFTLSGTGSQIVTVNFSPIATGSQLASLTLSSSGGSVATVSLSGFSPYWIEKQILSGSVTRNTNGYQFDIADSYGYSISINANNDVMVIGAPGASNGTLGGIGTATIYVRDASGWKEQKLLSGSLASFADFFGTSVAINSAGNRVIIGAVQDGSIQQGLAYIFDSGSNGWTQKHILSGTLAIQQSDQFGYSVAINSIGDRVIVGAMQDEKIPGTNDGMGLAYIFDSGSNGWTQKHILSGTLAIDSGDHFGFSVAMNSVGNRVVVGAYTDKRVSGSTSEGLAYIFDSGSNGWTQKQILSGTFATGSNDLFGSAVSINSSGNRIVVGAPSDEKLTGQADTGLVYIFKSGSNGWIQEQILSGTYAINANDDFGVSVTINSEGDCIVVGATSDEISGSANSGLAYVFGSGSNGWVQQQIITCSIGSSYSQTSFGQAVAVDPLCNTIAVSGPGWDQLGYVSIFEKNN